MSNDDTDGAVNAEEKRKDHPEIKESKGFMADFALPSWYDSFKSITVKSVMLELPEEFVEYLSSDGCTLPAGCSLPSFPRQPQSEGEDSGEEYWSDDEAEEAPPSFSDLVTAISTAIDSLGSSGVFPKLNWSAPRDATWVSGTGTLCCSTPAEVIVLLKSSDFISHDLSLISEINANRTVEAPPLKCTGDYLLVDLNPFSPPTDPLLFDWEELCGWAGPSEVRLVEDGCVQPSPLQVHRLPQDFVDLSTGADIHKFVDLFYSRNLGST